MRTPKEHYEEIVQLVETLCDGQVTSEQAARLEDLVVGDKGCRRYYVRYLHMHASLPEFFPEQPGTAGSMQLQRLLECQASKATSNGHGNQRDPSPPFFDAAAGERSDDGPTSLILEFLGDLAQRGLDYFSRPAQLSVLIAAMVLASLLTLLAFWAVPLYRGGNPRQEPTVEPFYVARLTQTLDCEWAEERSSPLPPGEGRDEGAPVLGQLLKAGQHLDLVEGLAEITFDSGVRVILQGPAAFQPEAANSGRLELGKLTGNVPKKARGFAIRAPCVKVVDLGTEFGMQVDKMGTAEVHVFAGQVEAQRIDKAGRTTDSVRLGKGAAVRVEPGAAPLRGLAAEPARFARRVADVAGPIRGLPAGTRVAKLGQWDRASGGNGHWYALITPPVDWENAKRIAENATLVLPRNDNVAETKGHLATITLQAEHDFIATRIGATAWLGGRKGGGFGGKAGPSDFQWVTGEDWTFGTTETKGPWEPAITRPNPSGDGDALEFKRFGTKWHWNDISDAVRLDCLVEFDVP